MDAQALTAVAVYFNGLPVSFIQFTIQRVTVDILRDVFCDIALRPTIINGVYVQSDFLPRRTHHYLLLKSNAA